MDNIVIKDSDGKDVTFQVARQPSGSQSAILYEVSSTPGMNRTGLAKIELSTRVVNGKTTPVSSVTVPHGAVINGNFVKAGQATDVRSATQPADLPLKTRLDAAAFGRNLAGDPQVAAMFANGLL